MVRTAAGDSGLVSRAMRQPRGVGARAGARAALTWAHARGEEGPARRPPRLLRRRRPCGRDRREGTRALRGARVRAQADRPQQVRRRVARGPRRGLRRRGRGGPRGLDRRLLGPRRGAGGPRGGRRRHLKTIDATCPLVTKVHSEARRFANEGYRILLIGHEGHEEVVGTMGEAPEAMTLVEDSAEAATVEVPDTDRLVWLSQTTLSVDETLQHGRCAQGAVPQPGQPAERRHLLRHLEPAGGGEGDRAERATSSSWSGRATRRTPSGSSRSPSRPAPAPPTASTPRPSSRRTGSPTPPTVGVTSGASVPELLVNEVLAWLRRARLRRRRGGRDGGGDARVRAAAGAAPRHQGGGRA